MIRVLIIDDLKTVRQMLQNFLDGQPDIEVVGAASDGDSGLEQIEKLQPDVALVDLEMPGKHGLEVVREANQRYPKTNFLVLTTIDGVEVVSQALERGARGYLLKTTSGEDVRSAIRAVHQGFLQLSPDMQEKLVGAGNSLVSTSRSFVGSTTLQIPNKDPVLLPPATPEDFLPPIGKWPTVGGIVMLLGFIGAVGLSAVLPYTVTIRAAGKIRPEGELRVVQATAEGTIERIAVEGNQRVEKGDVIALIDDSQLLTQQRQLETSLERGRQQLSRLNGQLETITGQIIAQKESYERDAAAYRAELEMAQSNFRELQLVTQADVDAVEAEVALAREEYQRYQQLANSGGVSQLQVLEREASFNAASARLERAKASLNPNNASVIRASERLEQIRSSNVAALAALNRERGSLMQQQLELEEQLLQEEDDLGQVEINLQNTVVRAPVAGIVQQLNLRNIDQVVIRGDEIATIAPTNIDLLIEAYVASRDINMVEVGQTARMRVSSCPYTDFGTLEGTVFSISPDVSQLAEGSGQQDAKTQNFSNGFYKVQIKHTTVEMTSNSRRCLIQTGMNGILDIETVRESVLVFLLRKARLLSNI